MAAFLLQGCALFGTAKSPVLAKPGHASGIYHTVQKKESLWKICKAYGVSMQDVAELNNIKNTSQIKPGDKILGMKLDQGGHITHGLPISFPGRIFNFAFYGVDEISNLLVTAINDANRKAEKLSQENLINLSKQLEV